MADENKPAFYPRVGNIKAKNFRSAQPAPFIDDPRAMEMPQLGEVDIDVPTKANRELSERMGQRRNDLERQRNADMSPLEKVAGALEAVRFMGSALTQSINSFPTRIVHGDEAAEKFMQDRIYKPTQPKAYEYAQDVADFLEKLETEYKLPPIATGEVLGFAPLIQAGLADAARKGTGAAVRGGMALERGIEPVVRGALERGGLPREVALGMGANTQSNVIKREGGNWAVEPKMANLYQRAGYKPNLKETLAELQQTYTPEAMARLDDEGRNIVNQSIKDLNERIALEKWLDSNLKNYVKNEMGTPEDPIRLLIEKREAEINAKFELDKQRAQRVADRAEAEPDPRRKANLIRQSVQMMDEAEADRELALRHKSHLPPDLQNPESMWVPDELAESRKREGFPEEEIGKTLSSQMWEQMADQSIYPTKAGEIQRYPAEAARRAEAVNKFHAYEERLDDRLVPFLMKKGFSSDDIAGLLEMNPRNKAEMLGEEKTYQQLFRDIGGLPPNSHFLEYVNEASPWINKVDPNTSVYSGDVSGLNFDHIVDVLKQDLAEGRIRPEQLNKMSMEQAVRRTAEYDFERAKAMRDAQIKNMSGFPTYKEYPEGYKWIELVMPEKGEHLLTELDKRIIAQRKDNPVSPELMDKTLYQRAYEKLEDALKYEGDTMGHCVGGYCPDVAEGRSRIYSLRDTKGEPHVTIEVQPNFPTWSAAENILGKEKAQELWKEFSAINPEYGRKAPAQIADIFNQFLKTKDLEPIDYGSKIIQIKGKQNARPIEKYDPYTQDFVHSGNWSEVGDLKNTGLIDIRKSMIPWPKGTQAEQIDRLFGGMEGGTKTPLYKSNEEFFDKAQKELGKRYLTQGEYDDWLLKQLNPDTPPAPEMKRGGKVSISKNPDTMMLELNNQKMKNGVPAYGAGKAVIKEGLMAAKPPKVPPPIKFPVTRGPSIPEIRAMAERMAPQVMGEFVRAAPTPSAPKPSTSVVGKTQKQFEREKTLPIEYENIKPEVTPEEFDYAKKKGALLIGAAGDVTPANRMLLSIDQQPLSVPVHMQAGPEWELYNPTAWAASDQMAKTYMKRAGQAAEAYGADPYLHYHKMTPDANYYAMHHFNSLLSHLRPEELKLRDPKLYQQMVEEIRTKDVGYGKHPDFEGFEDPLNVQIHAQIDPNFRRHIGAMFNGPKFTQRYGLNSGQDVLAATSLPELRDLEAGASGYAIVPLDVKAPLRNFEAESQTYDTGFPKAGPSGRSKYPSPYQLIYRDTLNWMKEHPSENKSSEFGRMNMIVPKQQIDDELIDAIGEYQRRMKELTGKKKGGSVKKPINKAQGGAITGDDLIIEERPL